MYFNPNFCFLIIITLTSLIPQLGNSQDAFTQGEALIASAIAAHGGEAYETAHYEFVFREKTFTFHNQKDIYSYTMTMTKDGQSIIDKMSNNGFVRTVNGAEVELTTKQMNGHLERLNSVIYFTMLPYKLQDKAVNALFVSEQTIKNQTYSLVQVTFDQEGGGKDHDDTFMYWINKSSHTIDYLAYRYHVNGGGVRFRVAYNARVVEGILFQDYINYKSDMTTPLESLPALWEDNSLKELSRIVTEDMKSLK